MPAITGEPNLPPAADLANAVRHPRGVSPQGPAHADRARLEELGDYRNDAWRAWIERGNVNAERLAREAAKDSAPGAATVEAIRRVLASRVHADYLAAFADRDLPN